MMNTNYYPILEPEVKDNNTLGDFSEFLATQYIDCQLFNVEIDKIDKEACPKFSKLKELIFQLPLH